MEGVPASPKVPKMLKVKLLSIIRCSNSELLLTYFQNPFPLPQQFKRDPLRKQGFWVGVKLVKCRKKKW